MTSITVCQGGTKTIDYPLQPLASYGNLFNIYDDYNPLQDAVVDQYNRFTVRINRATFHTERKFLLDQRHKFYVQSMNDAKDSTLLKGNK